MKNQVLMQQQQLHYQNSIPFRVVYIRFYKMSRFSTDRSCNLLRIGYKIHFTGLASLKIKETDRIEALKIELRKLGFILHDEHEIL